MWVEEVDPDYERLLKQGVALIQSTTKEEIDLWFEYDRARIEADRLQHAYLEAEEAANVAREKWKSLSDKNISLIQEEVAKFDKIHW